MAADSDNQKMDRDPSKPLRLSTGESRITSDDLVELKISRDQVSLLLNLVDAHLTHLIHLTNTGAAEEFDNGEAARIYEEKDMCYALGKLLNI